MIVASISTATARPTPNCLKIDRRQRGEDREHGDHHAAAAVTTEAVRLIPRLTASAVDMPRS